MWETQHNNAGLACFKTLILQKTLKTRNQHQGGILCIFRSRTIVPISWVCKKQPSVSHSSTEAIARQCIVAEGLHRVHLPLRKCKWNIFNNQKWIDPRRKKSQKGQADRVFHCSEPDGRRPTYRRNSMQRGQANHRQKSVIWSRSLRHMTCRFHWKSGMHKNTWWALPKSSLFYKIYMTKRQEHLGTHQAIQRITVKNITTSWITESQAYHFQQRRRSTSSARNRRNWLPTWITPRSSNFSKILTNKNVLNAIPIGILGWSIAVVEVTWNLRGVQLHSNRTTVTSLQSHRHPQYFGSTRNIRDPIYGHTATISDRVAVSPRQSLLHLWRVTFASSCGQICGLCHVKETVWEEKDGLRRGAVLQHRDQREYLWAYPQSSSSSSNANSQSTLARKNLEQDTNRQDSYGTSWRNLIAKGDSTNLNSTESQRTQTLLHKPRSKQN